MSFYWILGLTFGVVLAVFLLFIIKKKQNTKSDYFNSALQVKETLGTKLRKAFGGRTLSEADFVTLEETLITADIGPAITTHLIEIIKNKKITKIDEAIIILKNELKSLLLEDRFKLEKGSLNIFLVLGVNGVGKTTSIAKLANLYLKHDFKVLLAAADTFRAAATEQINRWADRLAVPIIKQGEKADPASVVFDAMDSAIAKKVDLLIVDTAGRLHNKKNLIEELKKIERIIRNKGAYQQKNILVLDATTGQNAYTQAEVFNAAVKVDAIMLTKYDAQSKGGIIFTIEDKLKIPFVYIGSGEKLEDIHEFNKEQFVENIFS